MSIVVSTNSTEWGKKILICLDPAPSSPTTFDSFLNRSLYKTLRSAMVRVAFQKLLEVRGWEFKS